MDGSTLNCNKIFGNLYDSFELPGTKIYLWKEIHHGLVLLSDGKGVGKPARLELTRDSLTVQLPLALGIEVVDGAECTDTGLRMVSVRREKDGGLGFSVKGGTDSSGKVPVLISKIFKGQAADMTHQLFVGDAIMEVNGGNVENKSHDEVVALLKSAGTEVSLTVKHYGHMAPYLRGGSLMRDRSGSALERLSETGTWMSSLKSRFTSYDQASNAGSEDAPEGWKTLVKIPLPMAYMTRYLWGSDKIRPNAFEVRAVDGTSSGVVHCEDKKVLDQWVRHINANITQLNNKSIKMSNKFLHPSELIVFLGWVCERNNEGFEGDLWQTWEPRFLILKGNDVCAFESPPLNSEDLNKRVYSYKIYETVFRGVKESERMDKRDNCFYIETSSNLKHYISVESKQHLQQIEAAWHRATYYAVTRMQSKTFACNFEGRPSGLVLDLRQGFSLYDIPSKRYVWQYKFSQLKTSSDDGKMRVQLIFHNPKANIGEDVKDLDCSEVYPLVYTMHAFFVTRLISVDPDFLKSPWK